MTHLLALVMVALVASSDSAHSYGGWIDGRLAPLRAQAWWLVPAGFLAVVLVCWVVASSSARAMDRNGRLKDVRRADRALFWCQITATLWVGVCAHGLGWLGMVRSVTGDALLLDEAIALTPGVLTLCLLWAVFYPVERRLRESSMLGRLDRGEPVHPVPSRFVYTLDQARTHLGPTIVAALLLFAWVEAIDLGVAWTARTQPGIDAGTVDTVASVVLVVGAMGVVALLPVLWRVLWRTRRLPPGELRDELHALCARHGVRVADLLIWETRGAMLNGALVGLLPRLRYIMLTDALLERLPSQQVEAVMAHEIAHAKKRHIPWLIASIVVSAGIASAVPSVLLTRAAGLDTLWTQLASGAVGVAVAVLVLGWVSRRFEEQADAFAARHLALVRTGEECPVIAVPDAKGMADALAGVALHNHIAIKKFSFRHGSIMERQQRLARLVGHRADALAIDGRVRTLKRWVLVGGVALALLLWRFPEAGALL